MISFENVGRAYRGRKGEIGWVFRNLSFTLPDTASIGILAPRGHGKTTLINVAAGNEAPSEGRVFRTGRISWPYGFKGNISTKLTGRQNVRFLCDVYGRNFAEVFAFVEKFSELGKNLNSSLRQYSFEARARLSISTLFAMDFNYILVDDSMEGGDASFRRKCAQYIQDNASRLNFLIATSNPQIVTTYCQQAGVLNDGKVMMLGSVDEAIEEFNKVNLEFV